MTTYTEIPLNKLKLSPTNARQDPGDVRSLAASIRTLGLVSGLAVTKNGRGWLVEAGGRRLAALQQLHADGHIPKDHPVPCLLFDCPDLARSLAENTERQAMDPVQQFQAFARLLNEGRTEADVAEAFSVTVQFLRQRMKLASLIPEAIIAYRERRLDLEALTALTYGTPEQQLAIVRADHILPAWRIRDQLRGSVIQGDDKRVRLIGLQAYRDAGGATTEDIFASNVTILDEELLDRLVADRLQAEVDAKLADGYAFAVIVSHRWGDDAKPYEDCPRDFRPTPEQSAEIAGINERVNALETELDALPDDDTERADELGNTLSTLADRLEEIEDAASVAPSGSEIGVLISLDRDGSIETTEVVRKRVKSTTAPEPNEDGTPAAKPLTQRNTQELAQAREAAVALYIANTPTAALAMLAHAIDHALTESSTYQQPAPFSNHLQRSRNERPDAIQAQIMAITVPAADSRHADGIPPLTWYLQQPAADLATIIAHGLAQAITDPEASKQSYGPTSASASIQALIQHAGIKLADYWTPSAAWLKSYGKTNIINALDLCEYPTEGIENSKLSDLVDMALPVLTKARWVPREAGGAL